MEYIRQIQAFKPYQKNADYVDVKTIEGQVSLQEFIAAMLSHYPAWMVVLYRIRAIVVRLLGLARQEKPDTPYRLYPQDVPLTPGEKAAFFIVRDARKDAYWIAETPKDKHLRAYFGVAAEQLQASHKRFHVITVVHYKHWTGPVYFNLIRPFHHLVVLSMIRAAVRIRNPLKSPYR
jgi:hypothetical protein